MNFPNCVPQTTRRFALLGMLCASTLVACGSGSSDGNELAERNPDPLAAPDILNQCQENVSRLLALNIDASTSWSGPRSRYRATPSGSAKPFDWSPLRAITQGSSTTTSQESTAWGWQTRPAQCDPLLALLGQDTEGKFDTESYVAHALQLDHEIVNFSFPTDLGSVAEEQEPVAVETKSRLTLTFQRPTVGSDGTYDYSRMLYRDSDVQSWDLQDLSCQKPFTVEQVWEPRPDAESGTPFCKTETSGEKKCLSYVVRYTADQCQFTLRNGTFQFVGGTSLRANVAGHFDKSFAENGDSRGYMVRITNVEFQ